MNKLNFINDVMTCCSGNRIPIFCIQEHFLYRSNLYKIAKNLNNFSVLAKSAHKDFKNQDKGRPCGGLATVIPKNFRKYVSIVNCQSWRLQPLLISLKNMKYLVINSYFPTDPKNLNGNNVELEDLLAEIKSILNSNKFNSVYLVGDLNCDFLRNTVHVKTIDAFMTSTNLYSLWQDYPIDYTYSYENVGNNTSTFILDHFLALESSKQEVSSAGVLHLVENTSDHEPIYVIIQTNHREDKVDSVIRTNFNPKPCWKKADIDQKLDYNDVLFQKLLGIYVPSEAIGCRDVNCNDIKHKDDIDSYVSDILGAVSESGKFTIPTGKPGSSNGDNIKYKLRKKTVGWKEYVEPYQDQANFWNSI